MQEIDAEIDENDKDGGEQQNAAQNRKIPPLDGFESKAPEAGPAEDGFYHNAAAQDGADVNAEHCGQRQKRVALKTYPLTKPGGTYTQNVQVQGVPLQVPASVAVEILPVPGEKNIANNKGTFTAVFSP